MSQPWALVAPVGSARAIARLASVSGLAICELEEELWLQGSALNDELERQLRFIPGGRIFELLGDKQLIPRGRLVPRGRLPDGPWKLLIDWRDDALLLPEVMVGDLPSEHELRRMCLHLAPCNSPHEAAILETSFALFANHAVTAPQWRLDRWMFAVSSDGLILVQGTPLPPLPGAQFWLEEGICVPAGFGWQPEVDAVTVRQILHLQKDETAVLRADDSWDSVAADAWVKCTRSAVRLSREAHAK
jgi:hypothetical protein